MNRVLAVVALSLTLLVGLAPPASADPQDVANDVADEVMSPFCPGVTLHDCPSRAARDLQDRVVAWARRGLSKDDIIARLEAEFGSVVRAVPPPGPAGLAAWLFPAVALAAALALAFGAARAWAARRPADAPAASAEELQAISAELDRLRAER